MDSTKQPLDAEQTQLIVEEFMREGCALIPDVLTPQEIKLIRERTDFYAANPDSVAPKHNSFVGGAFVLRHGIELDTIFKEMVTRQPIQGIVQAILGTDARFNALNVIRNEPGNAISNWHVDDTVEFPLPDDIPRFDPRIRMPILWMTVQVALSDITSLENGPTQFVPGSHYSGRYPNSKENPEFEGVGAKSVFCKAGDIYLTNHQCWHRGAPNISDRTRYIMQLQYAKRWADSRFKGLA